MRRLLQTYGRLLAIVAVVLVAVGAVAIVHAVRSNQPDYSVRQACSVLTPQLAEVVARQRLLQQTVKPQQSKDTETTFCVYRGTAVSMSLTVRSPKDAKGAQLNHAAFDKPPVTSQRIYGYGDSAFWTPSFGQFNILKHDTWYIISYGADNPSQRTVTPAAQLAARLKL